MNNNESAPAIFPMTPTKREWVERRLMARLRFFAEYEYAKGEWYRHGDGRPVSEGGRGYSFPCCIHGMSSWTDYDNICGGCEQGDNYWDFDREAADAAREVDWVTAQVERRAELAIPLIMQSGPDALPREVSQGLSKWVSEPLHRF